MPDERRSPALDALFWREEILQVLYWMQGEGLAETVDARALQAFLQGDPATIMYHLEKCSREGYLVRSGTDADRRYRLSERGKEAGGRLFADAFSGMQRQGHGECSPDCICYEVGPDACPAHGHDHTHHHR